MTTSTFCVATMNSTDGWEIKSPQQALAKHFTYWFTSRANQGKVLASTPSFYYLWAKYGTDPETFVPRVKSEFESYIQELFPICDVKVVLANRSETGSSYNLQIAARVVSDGIAYDLAETVVVTGEHFRVLDKKRLG